MEKPTTSKAMNIINFFPSHPSSNESFIKRRVMQNKSYSGPIISIVPVEARRRPSKNGSQRGFETPKEPTSPKVSCIGQIKLRKNSLRCKSQRKGQQPGPDQVLTKQLSTKKQPKRTKSFSLRKIFQRKVKPGRSVSSLSSVDHVAVAGDGDESPASVAPSLGGMKKFASRRESLGDFDWRKVQVERSHEGGHHRRFSDEDISFNDDDDDYMVPHSAPLVMGGGVIASEPRKEVNLWMRRGAVVSPGHLQLN